MLVVIRNFRFGSQQPDTIYTLSWVKRDGNRCRHGSFLLSFRENETLEAVERSRFLCPQKKQRKSVSRSATLTIPKLEQSKTAVLNTLASAHSRRSYEYAIERFIAWYCDEPRLAFSRSVVVRYRSFLEGLSLSAATINLHLSVIRRLADESAESGWLSPELVTGIRRVKEVKRLGRKIGNWLTGNQAQDLLNAVSEQPSWYERWSNAGIVARMRVALGSRGFETGSAAIEGEPPARRSLRRSSVHSALGSPCEKTWVWAGFP